MLIESIGLENVEEAGDESIGQLKTESVDSTTDLVSQKLN